MKTSTRGIELIKSEEGFLPKAYKDGFVNNVQKYSIGYGHQIQSHEGSLLKRTLTKDEATLILINDVKTIENILNRNKVPITDQDEFDALVDFGFNCGAGALQNVLATYNTKTRTDTVNHIQQYRGQKTPQGYKVLPVLVERRAKEVAIFLKKKSSWLVTTLAFGFINSWYR